MTISSALGRLSVGLVLSLLFSLPAWSTTSGDHLWIGAPDSIYRIETDTGASTRLPLDVTGIIDLALDARRGRVWILKQDGRVAVHGLDGSLIRDLELGGDGAEPAGDVPRRPRAIAVNPQTGHAYAAWNGGLHFFDAEMEPHAAAHLSETVQAVVLDSVDDRIWAATARGVYEFAGAGERVQGFEVDGSYTIVDLAWNAASETLLLVLNGSVRTERILRVYATDGELMFETRLRDLAAVAADGSGGFWATGRRNVLRFNDGHQLACAMALRGTRSTPMLSAADSKGRSLWTAAGTRVVRLDENCAIAQRFATTDFEIVAMLFDDTDTTPPVLELSSVDAGSIIPARPELILSYADEGEGVDAGSLRLRVDGEETALECTEQAAQRGRCRPVSAIETPEPVLSISISDAAGNTTTLERAVLLDTDGDGVPDIEDVFPLDPEETTDLDGDGVGDNADPDRDGDGVANDEDPFPDDPTEWSDLDGDGVGDKIDPDRDGDGVPNGEDLFPDDPNESTDLDGDGAGDNSDLDIDGDGVPNDEDAFPRDASETVDTDGDGIGDNADPDIDGDGVPNERDAFPYDRTEQSDLDGDGVGDNRDPDRDGDGIANQFDAYPDDPTRYADLDGDGIPDDIDPDRDGDGVPNEDDALPDDPNESRDLDGDGIGDNSDPDLDGDGVPNEKDKFPDDPTEWSDLDGDGIGNNSDPDRDGDGIPNRRDPMPDTPGFGR